MTDSQQLYAVVLLSNVALRLFLKLFLFRFCNFNSVSNYCFTTTYMFLNSVKFSLCAADSYLQLHDSEIRKR